MEVKKNLGFIDLWTYHYFMASNPQITILFFSMGNTQHLLSRDSPKNIYAAPGSVWTSMTILQINCSHGSFDMMIL